MALLGFGLSVPKMKGARETTQGKEGWSMFFACRRLVQA